jgi:hypothetical protein
MVGPPLADSKTAAIQFLANTAPGDRGNLVQFESSAQLVLPSNWVTTDTDLDAQTQEQSISATLFYLASGMSAYATTPATVTPLGGGLYGYSATIPAAAVFYPGLLYYLRFTDGIQEVFLSFKYNTTPFSVSILKNHAAVIAHSPLNLAIPGQPLLVTAAISDPDVGDGVSQAIVSCRPHNDQQATPYFAVAMLRGPGDSYTATIPADAVTDAGVDYYISAWDSHQVRSDHGSEIAPHFASAAGCRLVGTPGLTDVGDHAVTLTVSDGQPVPGATAPVLALPGVRKGQSGDYVAVVSNLAGAVTSHVATVTVRGLGDVSGAPDLTWTTRGQSPWFSQTNITYDGLDTAKAAP